MVHSPNDEAEPFSRRRHRTGDHNQSSRLLSRPRVSYHLTAPHLCILQTLSLTVLWRKWSRDSESLLFPHRKAHREMWIDAIGPATARLLDAA